MPPSLAPCLKVLAALVASACLLTVAALVPVRLAMPGPYALRAEGAALGAGGQLTAVGPGEGVGIVPGTRVLASVPDEERSRLVGEQLRWLAHGVVPGEAARFDLARDALLDLHALTTHSGAVLAGPMGAWAYCWPRDASFVAAALAAAGHENDAERILDFLASVQSPDGTFAARYRADGAAVGDGRRDQLDGSGWVLWALGRVVREAPAAQQRALVARHADLWQRAVSALQASLQSDGLPAASSDYWERAERQVTLGTVAPALAGLQAAGFLAQVSGTVVAGLATDSQRLAAAIRSQFGPAYARYRDGQDMDAAIAFLLPPFVTGFEREALPALARARQDLARPAGGLAPGAGWKSDGVSWTPETALFGLAAAVNGDVSTARETLDWLDAHRTARGALPEKVLADGEPGSIAPLAWTASLVILTLTELEPAGS